MDTIKRQRKRHLKTKEIVIKVSDEGAPRFLAGMECRTETGLNCIGGSTQLKPPLRGPNRARESLSYCCFRHIRRGAASLTHAHCPLSSLFSSLFIHLLHLSPCTRDLAEDSLAPIATPFFALLYS